MSPTGYMGVVTDEMAAEMEARNLARAKEAIDALGNRYVLWKTRGSKEQVTAVNVQKIRSKTK